MKVIIVAKTRMGSGACVGGLTFDGRSVRLIAADADINDHFNLEYNIGDVWDVDFRAQDALLPPHVENIVVQSKRKMPPVQNVAPLIEQHMPPLSGGLDMLFEGLTAHTKAGALYICERFGVPAASTMFWRPDRPLVRDDDGKRIRYRYPTADNGRTLTFVGLQEPLSEIPAATLLRVSLAHWWRPADMPHGELRCYVQLSGWYQETAVSAWQPAFDDFDLPEPELTSEPMIWQPVPIEKPETKPFVPDMGAARDKLKRVFGYDAFRPLQAEIIENILHKQDSLAIMPTGSGKSLCYQLPALLFPGLTVVVSPLISLMEDQVTQLRAAGVNAVFLNSTLSYEAYSTTVAQIRRGAVKLLYLAPETLVRPETMLLLEQVQVDCFTIDEAHCISEWGHDFRPEYRQLIGVRQRLQDAVCIAVTATATERVRQDIKASLGITAAGEFLASFNRENLFLAVMPKTDGLSQALDFLRAHQNESGIIYCATRKQVDLLTAHLAGSGWPVLAYHAGLDDATRRENQRRFIHADTAVMVATIAFGMGINKPNVRFVLHYDLPKNLESYYQQIGRAGRDGLPSDCLLLYSFQDVATINYFIQQQADDQQKGARIRLDAMLAFAETNLCRRRPLLTYFGEEPQSDACDNCDSCTHDANQDELVDLTIPAQKYLSCVKRTGEIFGLTYIIDVLRGSRSKRVLARRHDRLSTYGIGEEFSKKEWQFLARQFISQGLLDQDMEHGSLRLTPKAYAVFKGEPFFGIAPEKPREAAVSLRRSADFDAALFEQLRAKRVDLATAAQVPPYVVFSDRALVEMATFFPQTHAAFSRINGVGEVKLAQYADIFLPIIQTYCRENNITPKPAAPLPVTPRAGGNRNAEVVGLFNNGRSVPEIAELYAVKKRTVINHLWRAVQNGQTVRQTDLTALVDASEDNRQKIVDAFAAHGVERLKPVFEALNGAVGYEDLEVLRLHCILLGS